MNSGALLPDSMANPLILQRLQMEDCKTKGFILDGFPRSASHLEFLKLHQIEPTVAIKINVSDELAIERQVGRVLDPISGKTYHVKFAPPQNEVAERVVKRATDNEEKAQIRLQVYNKEMSQASEWFAKEKSFEVDGSATEEQVFETIKKIVDQSIASTKQP